MEQPIVNHVFYSWVEQWYREATQANTKMRFVYRKAMTSIKNCSRPLHSGRDCEALEGIGPSIARKIDAKLELFYQEGNILHSNIQYDELPEIIADLTQESVAVAPKKVKPYMPTYRSGGFAILVALWADSLRPSSSGFLSKTQILSAAQPFCDSSFESTSYSAWSSASTLIKRNLIAKHGNPSKYSLTDEGADLAKQLYEALPESNTIVDTFVEETIEYSQDVHNSEAQLEILELKPGSFDIIMIIDSREQKGRNDRGYLQQELSKLGMPYETRSLEVGDFVWIARSHSSSAEVLLDFVIERKRGDDYCHSIIDGRYHEQKFRLRNCGLANVFYLIEPISKIDEAKIGADRIFASLLSTCVKEGLNVKQTGGVDDSVSFLCNLHHYIVNFYSNISLFYIPDNCLFDISYAKDRSDLEAKNNKEILPSYSAFMLLNRKGGNETVQEMYIKMLLCIKGMSLEKAIAVTTVFPSFNSFHEVSSQEVVTRLANATFGKFNRKIGLKMANLIKEVLL